MPHDKSEYQYLDLAAIDPAYARDIAIAKRKREQLAEAERNAALRPATVAAQPSQIEQFQDALKNRIAQEVKAVGNPFGTAEERAKNIVLQRRKEEAKTFGQ